MWRGDRRIERKAKLKRCEDIVNLFTHRDSWQMAPNITKITLSPNLPELRISILTMRTMGSYYTMGNYVEGRLLYHQTVFLMQAPGGSVNGEDEALINIFSCKSGSQASFLTLNDGLHRQRR